MKKIQLYTLSAALLVFGLSGLSAQAQNECRGAAIRMYIAGIFDVQDEYFESLAKAQNSETAEERAEAEQEALEEREEGSANLRATYNERVHLCDVLGEGKYTPTIDPDDFLSPDAIAANPNPYWPLIPGRTWTYQGDSEDGLETIVVTVTDETREILGVVCVVVLDVASLDGEVTEETYDWYAQDHTGNVWYFGEETFEYEDDRVVSIDGSFQAGEDGAHPGILIKAVPVVGDIYRQEFLLGEAEDIALVDALSTSRTVPFGSFTGCIRTAEWTPLEQNGFEFKYYAPGVGMILEESPDGETVELISMTQD